MGESIVPVCYLLEQGRSEQEAGATSFFKTLPAKETGKLLGGLDLLSSMGVMFSCRVSVDFK